MPHKIDLREGLPSAMGETPRRTADYEIDRSPLVRFTDKNYVLPRIDQEGIPVVSVNTEKIAVTIARSAIAILSQLCAPRDLLRNF